MTSTFLRTELTLILSRQGLIPDKGRMRVDDDKGMNLHAALFVALQRN